jgi:hypothetical protein
VNDTAPRRCTFVRADGSQCGANALRGGDPALSFFHSPRAERARREARRNGGRTRCRPAATLPADEPDADLGTLTNLAAYLARVINHTARGAIDPKIANSISSLSNVLARCVAQGDLERQLQAIQERLIALEVVKKGTKR